MKTIEEIHGLVDDDPWHTADDAVVTEASDIQKRVYDRLNREGFFAEKAFIDPPDDNDPTIIEECSLTSFWRLKIREKRIIDLIELEPSIKKIALSFKNTHVGCWIAFTARRVALRVANSLNTQGIFTELSNCDIKGSEFEMES